MTHKGERVLVTLQLLGISNEFFLGVKIAAYAQSTLRECGVFLMVDQESWQYEER